MRIKAILGLFLTAALPLTALADETAIHVTDAYFVATGAKATVGAGYLKVKNIGAEADRLLSVTSDAAAHVMLHESEMDASGVMTMDALDGGVEIAPGASHEFKRGGDHVMFMGLTAPVETGSSVTAVLHFEKAGDVTVEMPVNPDPAPGG